MLPTTRYPAALAIPAVAICLLATASSAMIAVPPTASARAAAPSLLQATAGGHVLGFAPGGVTVSNGGYALRVDFVGASPVEPVQAGAGAEGVGVPTPMRTQRKQLPHSPR